MRLGLVSLSFAPENTGIGPYSAELAGQLACRGHQVRVVTTFPFYPQWRVRVPSRFALFERHHHGGVTVERVRCYIPAHPDGLRRVAHDLSFAFASLVPVWRLARWADATIVVTPSFGSAVQCAFLSRIGVGRFHLHVQDLVTDLASEVGLMQGRAWMRLARGLARLVYQSFGSISVLSCEMTQSMSTHGVPADRVVVAPNWVRRWPGSAQDSERPVGGNPYVLFAGSFGRKQGLERLTRIAGALEEVRGPRVVVLGEGVGREQVIRAGSWLYWPGLVDEASYDRYVTCALAGIVALVRGVGSSVVPSKVLGYMAAAIPVLVLADEGAAICRLVREAGCGVVVPADDVDGAVMAIKRLAENPEERLRMGAAGAKFARTHWSRDAIVEQIETRLERLGQGPNSHAAMR